MTIRLARHVLADPLSAPGIGPRMTTELAATWLVWDACVAGKRRVDLHPLMVSEGAWDEACRVAERAAALVARMATRAATDPEERARYRFHDDVETLAAASREAGKTNDLVRVDLLASASGRLVACEVNADCPGGYNEVVALPRLARASGWTAGRDPSTVVGELVDRLVALSGGPGSPRGLVALVFATGYAEDLQICALLERLIRERGGRARRVSPTQLTGGEGDTVQVRGERVAVLYRFYPVEYMAGQANIPAIARAVRAGTLRTLSSFATAHAQSKLAMARAFVHEPQEARELFAETWAMRDVERAHVLEEHAAWVVKRDLSRVGDHVLVGASMARGDFAGALDEVKDAEELDGDVWIAQRFVPQAPVPTPWGPRWLTFGVYVMDGRACGAFARLAEGLTCSHDALVVPVFVEEAA